MGPVKAMIVVAALEFTRRRIKPRGLKIKTPADVLPLFIRNYADRLQEHFLCITINGANKVLNVRVVSIGLIDRTPVHPREVFADAITDRASGIILAHNHPEGGVEPSDADAEVTRRIKQAGEILGIHLLDHIIFNPTTYFSFLEAGKIMKPGGTYGDFQRPRSPQQLVRQSVPSSPKARKRPQPNDRALSADFFLRNPLTQFRHRLRRHTKFTTLDLHGRDLQQREHDRRVAPLGGDIVHPLPKVGVQDKSRIRTDPQRNFFLWKGFAYIEFTSHHHAGRERRR